MKLGEFLIGHGKLLPQQVDEALQCQVAFGGRLGTNLVELGYLSVGELARYLSAQTGVPFAEDAWLARAEPKALYSVPLSLIQRRRVVPLNVEERLIHVAMMDPLNADHLDDIRFATNRRVRAYVLPELRMHYWMEMHFGIRREVRYVDLGSEMKGRFVGQTASKAAAPATPKSIDAGDPNVVQPLDPEQELLDELTFQQTYQRTTGSAQALSPIDAESAGAVGTVPSGNPPLGFTPLPALAMTPPPTLSSNAPPGFTPLPSLITQKIAIGRPPSAVKPPPLREPSVLEAAMAQSPASTPKPRFPTGEAPAFQLPQLEPASVPPAGGPAASAPAISGSALAAVPAVAPAPPARTNEPLPTTPGKLAELEAQLERAETRDQIIHTSLLIAGQLTRVAAIFMVHQGIISGVKGVGGRLDRCAMDAIILSMAASSLIATAAGTAQPYRGKIGDYEADIRVVRSMGRGDVTEIGIIPIKIRERVVNLLYIDNGPDPLANTAHAALLALADCMSAAYERLILERKRTS